MELEDNFLILLPLFINFMQLVFVNVYEIKYEGGRTLQNDMLKCSQNFFLVTSKMMPPVRSACGVGLYNRKHSAPFFQLHLDP